MMLSVETKRLNVNLSPAAPDLSPPGGAARGGDDGGAARCGRGSPVPGLQQARVLRQVRGARAHHGQVQRGPGEACLPGTASSNFDLINPVSNILLWVRNV